MHRHHRNFDARVEVMDEGIAQVASANGRFIKGGERLLSRTRTFG
jgi:hypothetical protein